MGKKEKPKFLDYLNAVKKADREREIAQHGKLISTRPLRIVKSKKVYDRKRDRRDCSNYNDGSLFFCGSEERMIAWCSQFARLFLVTSNSVFH